MRLRAEVAKLNELSGHADQKGLLRWIRPVAKGFKKVFLVHGEPPAQNVLAQAIRDEHGIEVLVPARGEAWELT
jgi:metallo-beta-lactamase family protein